MRCTVTPCGLDLGPWVSDSKTSQRSSRRRSSPEYSRWSLDEKMGEFQKFTALSRPHIVEADLWIQRPEVAATHTPFFLDWTAICAQATLPKKKSKAWIQEENPLNQWWKNNFFSYIPVGDIQHLGLSEHRVPQNLTLDHHCPNSIAILWG